ncbi:TPA: helix-turn-helix domain-containing protein [Vibrio parahaemolyticus]|nr:helix-turn-helix domain-containing protein [Vibrio parahaemolyticus]HCG7083615.1 helix-turn-helix domain-containing protein [Vibrio parahaemolyticus]HCH0725461.1 helix-turn-helix domain-containing protein [Vibrio parahaemolyticus]HCH1053907.1 helix-turn-helix domain-containing protein [Vibrio parahaemolyticus]HCH5614476.1 helix-turn-helix domain-containing protein [Vibrio parahaemolyticus]
MPECNTTPTEPLALTVEQFAAKFQLNPETVRTNVSRAPHLLPPVIKFGRSVRFLVADINDWIKRQR